MATAMWDIPWHEGESTMHTLLAVPEQYNPIQPLLSVGAGRRFASSPLVAIGARDLQHRPWATVWGGAPGVAEPLGARWLE